jgi:hypothetical protein
MAELAFLAALAAFVFVKVAVLIGTDSSLFDALPRPTQID